MKDLKDILRAVDVISIRGDLAEVRISQICIDSRKLSSNSLFVAIVGNNVDGHQYIQKAIESGAVAVVCNVLPEILSEKVVYVVVENSQFVLGKLAANYYDNPADKLKLVGVTGTNGKTTTATLLYELFNSIGHKAGLISTVKIAIVKDTFKANMTTPDSLIINDYLNRMIEAGCEYCFMEVSSHGIAQYRTEHLNFAGGIFTNLSVDHFDYHKNMAQYRDVKKHFFDNLPKSAFAITNIDDINGNYMVQNTKARIRTYGLKNMADYKAQIMESSFNGLVLKINDTEVYTQLMGNFNAYNLLTVYAVAIELGVEITDALVAISKLQSVEGRFQYYISKQGIVVIVDYAHTPDALENILKTICEIRTNNEKLITVVGCGGNRDKGKRPMMGKIASENSDLLIITTDNPRFEEPQDIIKEIEAGVELHNSRKVLSIADRKQAIKTACIQAQSKDIVVIAGKGHESYQDVKGVKTHFSDIEVVSEFLEIIN